MGHIHVRPTKKEPPRYQVEIRRKGHPPIFRTFHRKTDAEKWMHKTEADICSGRSSLFRRLKRRNSKGAPVK